MKRILITGKTSYVGNALAGWLAKEPEKYKVDKISLRTDEWKRADFSIYDSIVHVAGIAHQKETKKNAYLYYKTNRDLAYNLAQKAKTSGVPHFIFLSTMSVYGLDEGVIDENTPLKPKTHYGKSKLEAEKQISTLEDDDFKIAIVRPPMIYGKGCPGNYQRLRRLALKTPIFPDIQNKRSMIYIDNLSEFIKRIIDHLMEGLFLPQNKEYSCTKDIVKIIAEVNNKKIYFVPFSKKIFKVLNLPITKKVFGNLIYSDSIKAVNFIQEKFNLKQSIYLTEGKGERHNE